MNRQSLDREELTEFLARTLNTAQIQDYCPNGLQVEGRREIRTLISGVTASLALIEAARDAGADAVLVHHGYFWRDENPCVVGTKQRRLKMLLQNDINLFAYHLPLDLHAELGNNAQLAKRLGLTADGRFGRNDIGWLGRADASLGTLGDLATRVTERLGREPLLIGNQATALGRVAWCSGAAQNMLADAAAAGASVFLSGELSEQTMHLARETSTAYLACGHHATERYGVQALGELVAQTFGVTHRFIDIDNPA